jgi:hypothetical protein
MPHRWEWTFRITEVVVIGFVGLYVAFQQSNLMRTQNQLIETQNKLLAGQTQLLKSANEIASAQRALSESMVQRDEPIRLWVEGDKDGALRLRNNSRVPLAYVEIRSIEFFYSFATRKAIGGTTVGSGLQPAAVIMALDPSQAADIKTTFLGKATGAGPVGAALRLEVTAAHARTFERKGPFFFFFKVATDGKLVPSFALGQSSGASFDWSFPEDKQLFAAFASKLQQYDVLYELERKYHNFEAPFWGLGLEAALK